MRIKEVTRQSVICDLRFEEFTKLMEKVTDRRMATRIKVLVGYRDGVRCMIPRRIFKGFFYNTEKWEDSYLFGSEGDKGDKDATGSTD